MVKDNMENQENTQSKKEAEQELFALKAEWQKYFKMPPPIKSSREFLSKNISWQKQAKEQGINLKRFHKMMNMALSQYELGKKVKHELVVKSGTRFIRQWQGKTHEVEAAGSTFIYNRENYKSLSAIARKITGAQWNGKLFFGVKK
ncbi:MAG: DUF2924 domain-containing protein [Syntrophomonadaceae bacterium]|jgi:beta-xylosidase|nr:DUF2924 domain-containing protein [Syntrophomonadaceae bacterium]